MVFSRFVKLIQYIMHIPSTLPHDRAIVEAAEAEVSGGWDCQNLR
jgi:hypothetical protein